MQEQLLLTRSVELAELKRIWEINPQDLVLKQRIDGSCVGSYGEVRAHGVGAAWEGSDSSGFFACVTC